jgi:fatty-acyl-CoA synthase
MSYIAMLPAESSDCAEDPARRRQWTYAEFIKEAERVARALLARFQPGDRIAVWAPNSAEWIILQQGISLGGMVLVALNPAYRAREMQFTLTQSGAAGLFCVDEYRGFDMRELARMPRAPVLDVPARIPGDGGERLQSGSHDR